MAESLTRQSLLDMISQQQLVENCTLYTIPCPTNPRDGEIVTEGHVRALLAALKRYFDLIFIDTTATVSDVTLPALQESHQILSVCLLDVMSVASLRTSLDLFDDPDLNIPADRMSILINRVGKDHSKGLVKISHIEDLFDAPLLESIPDDSAWVEPRLASSEFLVTGDWKHPYQKALLLVLDELNLAGE
jgi:Flp pilus assembly CpaE family ATPase